MPAIHVMDRGRRQFAGIHAVDLSAHVLTALAARNGLDPAVVDDVIWGCVQQVGQQAGDVGRMAVLADNQGAVFAVVSASGAGG